MHKKGSKKLLQYFCARGKTGYATIWKNKSLLVTSVYEITLQVVDYLLGNHDDIGCNGDRGDFYRRKLAEQIYVNFRVHYITHMNVLDLVYSIIKLEHDTRLALEKYGANRCSAPFIHIDSQVLDVLARIADIH